MRRRDCIVILGIAAVLSPLPLRAQRTARVPRLGVLLYSTPHADPNIEAFRRGLREGNRDTDVAEGPAVLRPRTVHAVTIRDDGQTITALLDGRALFPGVRDERFTAGTGVGLVARAAAGGLVIRALEAHPRLCPLPAPLAFAGPWQDEGRTTFAAEDFRAPAAPLHGRRW